jgi:hypothetical protein
MTKRSVIYFRRKWNRKRIGAESYPLGVPSNPEPWGFGDMAIMMPSAAPLTHADGTLVVPDIEYAYPRLPTDWHHPNEIPGFNLDKDFTEIMLRGDMEKRERLSVDIDKKLSYEPMWRNDQSDADERSVASEAK